METLVYLHGGGVTPKDYQDLIESLKKKYLVIAPNLYDLAETKKFTWREMAGNLDKLLGGKKVYLVGTSLGADLALAYAAFYPQKVKTVVACEPVGKMERSVIGWAYALQKTTMRALFYPGGFRAIMKPRFNFLKEGALNFRKIYSLAKMVRKEDYERFLVKIKAPVYLLWSKNSGLLPLWVGKRLHQRIPNSKFNPKFSNKNHLWCFLEQERIAQEVKKIFAR